MNRTILYILIGIIVIVLLWLLFASRLTPSQSVQQEATTVSPTPMASPTAMPSATPVPSITITPTISVTPTVSPTGTPVPTGQTTPSPTVQ